MNKANNTTQEYKAVLKCIACGKEYPLQSIRYLCDECRGLLNVHHDRQALRRRAPDFWRELFDGRLRSFEFPFQSGIWSKKEWVLPDIDPAHIVTLGEGYSPLQSLPRLADRLGLGGLAIKQCGVSHTGSFKDLGMTVLVSHVVSLRAAGLPIRAVACASTGDTSAALAAYAATAGIPTIVFLPAGKISTAQLVQPLANGALVLSLDTDFDGCMKIVREVTENSDIYLANSMNPLRIEGQKTISIELCQQLGWEVPDWIVIPGGNLGNVSALAAGFDLLLDAGIIKRRPRIALAQAGNANPMYLSYQKKYRDYRPVAARRTLASAIQIGDPVSYPRAVRALQEYDGVVEQASEQELADAAARVDRHGMFNCPHTGVALAALFKLVSAGEIRKGERVIVISTAHGLKFAGFKSGYHEGTLDGVDPSISAYRNQFLRLPPDTGKILDVLKERFDRDDY